MKDSKYMNPDGTFKGGFSGCVSHMIEVEGHSKESATKICGYIAQHVKNRGGEFRPHPSPLPQERGLPLQPPRHRFASSPFPAHPSADGRHRPGAEPVTGCGASATVGPHDSTAATVPPSPGGDGGSAQRRGEGGTFHQLSPLLNRAADGKFALPADGWFQLAPKGEYPHSDSGQLQVLDEPAINAMVQRFEAESRAPNSAGLLIDYDHFSYDTDKPSEAAGWITALQNRGETPTPAAAGLWARVKWTPAGEAAIKNGNYRFISPVWLPDQVEKLANHKVRPLRLDTAGLTNSPNLKGMVPLSNRRGALPPEGGDPGTPPSGGSAPADNPNQSKGKMKNVCLALGLSAEASEEAALAEVAQLKNRAETAEKAVEPLKNRVTELESARAELLAAQVEADLDKYQNRFDPKAREKWRAQLLAHRPATIDLLDSLPRGPAVGGASSTRPHLTIPIHNRAAAATPGDRPSGQAPGTVHGEAPDEDAAKAIAAARRIANRAKELSKSLG